MISIIITAYKEPQTIGKAITSILEQDIPEKHEIIVTAPDNATLEASKKYGPKIRAIKDKGKGKPSALNLVFKKAKGEILILTDGDVYTKNIGALLKYFQDKEVGAVTGRPVPVEKRKSMMGYWPHFLLSAAHMLRKKRDRQKKFLFCSGYLFALRRNIIKKIPPYSLDDACISECVWAKGYRIRYEDQALVFIKNPTHLKDWIKQKKRNVYSEFQLKQYQKNLMEALNFKGDVSMRSFKSELLGGIGFALSYPKSIKEYFYTLLLFGARLYVWILAYFELYFKKKPMKDIWIRVESTK